MKKCLKILLLLSVVLLFNSCSSFIKSLNNEIQSIDGLILYYPLDGEADDKSNNGINGITKNTSPTENRFGKSNSAFSFDRFDSEIDCGNSELLNFSKVVTISLFFKVDNFVNNFSPIIYKGWIKGSKEVYNGVERSYSLWIEKSGIIHFTTADEYGQQFTNSDTGTVIKNVWYHFVGIINREEGYIESYLNGELLSRNEIRKTNSLVTDKSLLIGSSHEKYHTFSNFKGCIDDVRIYNSVLSRKNIKDLYYENGWNLGNFYHRY